MVKAVFAILGAAAIALLAVATPARAVELPTYTDAQMCGSDSAANREHCLQSQRRAKAMIEEFVRSGTRAGDPRLLTSCIETKDKRLIGHESGYSAISLCLRRARHAWQLDELRSNGLIPTDRCDDRIENCTTVQKAALVHLLRGDFPIDDQRFDACLEKTLAGHMGIVWMGQCAKSSWDEQVARGKE